MKKSLVAVLSMLVLYSCGNNTTSSSNSEKDSTSIEPQSLLASNETSPSAKLPENAEVVGEWEDYVAYTVVVSEAEEGDCPQKELWLENKAKGYCGKLLTTSKEWVEVDWNESKEYPVSNIMAVDQVEFFKAKNNNDYMVVVGCPDCRNEFVYLMPISFNPSKARFIPAPSGFMSYDKENDQLKCMGYYYHDEGGRYETIKTFTMDGKLLSTEETDVEY